MGKIGTGVGQVGTGLARIGTIGATVAAAGLGAVVTTAISFESAFAGVRKTVDATDEELADLRNGFKELTREIPLSFEELAGIGEQAGALGIAKEDILEFTRVVALIGTTTNVSSQEAATSLGQLSNVLGLVAEDYDNFGATLVDLGNKGASTEADILGLATRAGAGANLIGIASDQTLGWASSVANLGIEVEAGGSSLQKFFLDTLQNIQKNDTLNLMAKTAGLTGKAYKQAFEKDASGALVKFIEGLGKLDQAEQLAVLEGLGFNDVRITRTLLGLAGDTDNLTDSLNIASEAWKENTALTEEAQKRFETTEAQLTILKEGIRGAGDTIGSALLPKLTPLIADLNKFLTDHEADIATFGEKLATGLAGFADKLKTVDFSGVVDGLKILRDVGKEVVDTFLRLPPNIQALLITGFAVNKLSGGLLGKGVGNIAGGVFKILFERGSSPANPLWVQSVGGVGGPGGVAGKVPLVATLGAVGVAGAGTIFSSGSNANEQTQAQMAAFAARKSGATLKDVFATGATLGALYALANDPALRQGIDPKLLAEIDKLASQIGTITTTQTGELTRDQQRTRAMYGTESAAARLGISRLLVPLGLGNELARQINENAAAVVAKQAATEATLSRWGTKLDLIAAKQTSFTVNLPITVNARLSVTQALATQTIINSIRSDFVPGDTTGGSL